MAGTEPGIGTVPFWPPGKEPRSKERARTIVDKCEYILNIDKEEMVRPSRKFLPVKPPGTGFPRLCVTCLNTESGATTLNDRRGTRGNECAIRSSSNFWQEHERDEERCLIHFWPETCHIYESEKAGVMVLQWYLAYVYHSILPTDRSGTSH
jgi:hypothetical protein